MSYLTRYEIEDLRPDLDRMVYKVLGNTDSEIRNIVENCLYSGFDRKRTTEKLSDVLDSKKASRMYDKLEDVLQDYKANSKSRKRPHETEEKKEKEYKKPKPMRNERDYTSREREVPTTTNNANLAGTALPSAKLDSSLTSNQIQQMMLNAQREIEERKRALSVLKTKDSPMLTSQQLALPVHLAAQKLRPSASPEEIERAKKIADLQAQIRAKLSGIGAQTGIIPQVCRSSQHFHIPC